MKRFLWGIIIVTIALGGGVLVAPSFVNWNDYKSDITEQVRLLTGRHLTLQGDIKFSILPAPALTANSISLSNSEGASDSEMIRLKSAEVRIALAPLLGGRIKVETIKLIEPIIKLEILANGQPNWTFEPETGSTVELSGPSSPSPETAASPAAEKLPAITLDDFVIEKGTIEFQDHTTGTREKVNNLSARFVAASLGGPYESTGSFSTRNIPITYDASIGEIAQGRTIPFNLRFGLAASDARLALSGRIAGHQDTPRVNATLTAKGANLAKAISAITHIPLDIAALSTGFETETTLTANEKSVELSELTFRLGDTKATGSVEVELGKELKFAAKLAANKVDLDELLKAKHVISSSSESSTTAAVSVDLPKPTDPANASGSGVLIPKNINGSIDLSVEAISYKKGLIRNGTFNASIANGEATISQLSAQLPGGSDFAAFGFLTTDNGKPRFEGEVESTVNNLRAVTSWLGADLKGIPADRLRILKLKTKTVLTDQHLQLLDLNFTFDSSHLTGGVTIALSKRPSLGAALTLDKINLDSYLPKAQAPATSNTNSNTAPSGAPAANTPPSADQTVNPFSALAILTRFDINMNARIKNLVYQGTQVKDVWFDGTLFDGNLELRKGSVGKLAGASLTSSGNILNLGSIPSLKGFKFETKTSNIGPLSALAGVDNPVDPKRLGKVSIKGQVDGSLLRPKLALDVNGGGANIKSNGTVSLIPLTNLYSGQVTFTHNNLPKFLKLFGVTYQPVGKHRQFDLTTTLETDKKIVSLSNLKGSFGKLPFSANASLSLKQAKPSIAANINTGPIDIMSFLPSVKKAASDLQGKTGKVIPAAWNGNSLNKARNKLLYKSALSSGRWSAEPIDLSVLGLVNADITLNAPVLIYQKYLIEKPVISAVINEGVLQTRQLKGLIFGGPFDGRINLDSTRANSLQAQAKIAGARVEQAMAAVTNTGGTTGSMDINLDLTSSALSMKSLAGTLAGNGNFAFRDIDVRKSAKGSSLAGFLDLFLSMNKMSGDKGSGNATVTGTFVANKGTARTNDIKMTSGFGDGTAAGTVNLADWMINMDGVMNVKPNVLSAIIATRTKRNLSKLPFSIRGPLDNPDIKIDRGDFGGNTIPGASKLIQKAPPALQGLLQGVLGGGLQQQPSPQPQPLGQPSPQGSPSEPTPQPQPQPQPQQVQPQQITPQDLLKSLFK